MRSLFALATALLVPSFLNAQTPPPPQTARQALIEMFFGQAPNHLEKHLPDVTRRTFQKLGTANGQNALAEFSLLASQAKAGGGRFETFDTGPTLLVAEQPQTGSDKVEITVERDDLIGDEDQIEVALHLTRGSKEETVPFIPRFTFSMKMESDVWRLNEVSVTVRLPLADPDFLRSIGNRQRSQNEQMVIWSIRTVVSAEKSYESTHSRFACSLSALGNSGKQGSGAGPAYVYDPDLAAGKKWGYVYAISGCDGSHYKIVGEPAMPNSGQRAFCSDENGIVRSSADGKAASCLSSGEAVDEKSSDDKATGLGVAFP